MPYLLKVTGALNKYVTCNIPQPAIDTGRALQVEYEDEFEVRRTATDWPVASTNWTAANDLIFLRSGSDVEIRSTGNSNWTVTTGVDLTQFHIFRIRTTFNGTIATRQLYVDGVLKGTTTALSNARMGALTAFFGLAGDATRSGEFKYFKRTDFVNAANSRFYNADLSGGTGNIIPESLYGLNGSQQGSWPANDSEWVPYGNVSVPQDVAVPASKQQDVAATVAIGTNQVLTVTGSKQQDTATVVTIGTTQVLTVPAAKQQDTVTSLTIGTNQVLSVPAAKQQDVAAAVSVAQVAPGSQPITVPAAKQQDAAGVVTVGTSQLITAAGTKQHDKASEISIGQSQIVSVAAIKQQDKAAPITIGTIQTLAVQPVTQADTAARVAVGTTQLVAVPSAQQIDRAAAITLTQQPPITQTIDVRTLRIELTTPRFGVARNTPVYTAQLTTPRYTVARA